MLQFTSILPDEYTSDLEQLLFFNPGQQLALRQIIDSVEKFGTPSIHREGGNLRVKVEKLDDVQTLFAMDEDALAGVLVYTRTSIDALAVLHIAVDHDYSSQGVLHQHLLAMRLISLLRHNARRIKGILHIRLMHSGNRVQKISVK